MKNLRDWCLAIPALLVMTASIFAQSAPPQPQPQWQELVHAMPKLPPFHPVEPKRVEMPNGMVIFLQEDHELPLIDGVARIRGGSRSEPSGKVGLVDLYGDVWRTGGTHTQTGDQLDDFLEIRAAKVETGSGIDSTTIGWSSLKQDFNDVFAIFVDLLRNPEFRADKLELAKQAEYDAISRRNDSVSSIVGRESAKLAYGPNNPYALSPEYATIAAVTRDDMVAWHKQYVQPNNIILGIVGDFDSAEMERKLRDAFAGWPRGTAAADPRIAFTAAKPGYYFVNKSDVNQSSVRMLGEGTTKQDPDFYAIEVFNEAFGGGFSSRLFRDLRTTKALAYSVGGGIGTRFDHPGVLQLAIGTKSESTVEAIRGLYQEVEDLKTKPLDDQEIKQAKDSILNSFIFNFDTPDKVLRERMAYEFYHYPPDFLERYRAGIEKVQPADVARVAAKFVLDKHLPVLVVGNSAEFDKPLSSLGPVTTLDIAIPPPPAEPKPAGQ